MNNNIQRFDFKGAALRTLTDENGEPWFVAKDVCDVLGYTNASKAISDHVDSEDKLNNESLSSLGQRGGWLVNESGLYSLVLSSKLPTAKEFKRWVTHEVLPQIRKTGGYIPTSDADDDMTILAKAVMIGQRTMEAQKQKIAAQDAHIRELEPKAQALDDFTNVPDALLVRDAAKLLSNSGTRIGEHELRQWLVDNGWIYRQPNQSWCAASSRVRKGHMVMVSSRSHGIHKDGRPFAYPPTPKLTRKGLALIHQRLSEQSFERVLDAEVAA